MLNIISEITKDERELDYSTFISIDKKVDSRESVLSINENNNNFEN